jgi:hypothetical protein
MLMAVSGCGLPLLWWRLPWAYYWQVNVPITVTLIIADWLVSRRLDRIVRCETPRSTEMQPRRGHPVVSPCKLPIELVRQPPRRIKDLKPGESAHVIFAALVVDEARNCYIHPSEELCAQCSFETIGIKRTETGVEATLNPSVRYRTRDILGSNLIPVTAIHLAVDAR